MDLSQAPAFVAVKLAMLSDACATATIRADELTAKISNLRDRWSGRTARQGVITRRNSHRARRAAARRAKGASTAAPD
jgi:hypothetical protein